MRQVELWEVKREDNQVEEERAVLSLVAAPQGKLVEVAISVEAVAEGLAESVAQLVAAPQGRVAVWEEVVEGRSEEGEVPQVEVWLDRTVEAVLVEVVEEGVEVLVVRLVVALQVNQEKEVVSGAH